MYRDYIAALFQTYAASRTSKGWRHFWRLKKLGLQWQLRNANKVGTEIEIRGPLIIRNKGCVEIGKHKPIYFSLDKPEANLYIENNAFINYGTEISLKSNVFIGAYSQISIDCLIYDTDWHSLDGVSEEAPAQPVHIGRGVWLGARVMVLKGVTIGDNTVVAANSVVTRDLPANVLAGGTPAQIIRPIDRRRFDPSRMNNEPQ
jgi:maltose O-acetyltransferase